MAVTLGGFIGVRVAVLAWLRPHYLSAVTVTSNLTATAQTKLTGSYWLIHQGALNPAGQLVAAPSGNVGTVYGGVPVGQLPKACAGLANPTGSMTSSCQAALSGFRSFLTYQPASRFWAFQGIETGIFIALAAILLTVTAAVLIRRDA